MRPFRRYARPTLSTGRSRRSSTDRTPPPILRPPLRKPLQRIVSAERSNNCQANNRMETVMRTGWGVAATIAAAGIMFAPAGLATAEPTQQNNADQTIGLLEDEGYNVIIDRVGSAP